MGMKVNYHLPCIIVREKGRMLDSGMGRCYNAPSRRLERGAGDDCIAIAELAGKLRSPLRH